MFLESLYLGVPRLWSLFMEFSPEAGTKKKLDRVSEDSLLAWAAGLLNHSFSFHTGENLIIHKFITLTGFITLGTF